MIYSLTLVFLIHAQADTITAAQLSSTQTQTQSTPEKIEITDKSDATFLNTISPHRISKSKVQLYNYSDVTRTLKQSAGVYARDEDGQGLRPNIGLRGTNPDRSKKVVFLEDDILIGPAPYAAPAAYYHPSMSHVESVDIYKGFTAVPYGPNSIGGSINYNSSSLPTTDKTSGQVSLGAFNTQNYKLGSGYSAGKTSLLVEGSRLSSDGFKVLDGGGDVGFEKNEILLKGRYKISSDTGREHYFESRLGYSDEVSNETYLGLTVNDLNANPFRRYSASALDKMTWQHSKLQLEHVYDLSTTTRLKTSIYRHDFERLWFRLDRFSNSNNPSLFSVLANPQQNPFLTGILNGTVNSSEAVGNIGNLFFVGNQRTFYSQGVQSKINTQFSTGPVQHDLEVGARFHQDQIRRNHSGQEYAMIGGRPIKTSAAQTVEDLNSNRATASTLHFVENMTLGKWVFTGLGRIENVNFVFQEVPNGPGSSLGNVQERNDTVFAPGAALLYKINDQLTIKTSINRGVTVAGLSDRGDEKPEESTNYEIGLKYISEDTKTQAEVLAFYNDYSNITGTCTGSTGCDPSQLDQQFNGGRALIQGLEARAAHNVYFKNVQVPVQLNLTALNAEFRNSFNSPTAEWGVGQVQNGDPLPYIPQIQYTVSVGTVYKKWTQEFAFIYQSDAFDQSVRENRLVIPAHGLVDWTGKLELNKKTQLFARIDNLLAREYIVSYKPFGARPGKPQSFMVGLTHTF